MRNSLYFWYYVERIFWIFRAKQIGTFLGSLHFAWSNLIWKEDRFKAEEGRNRNFPVMSDGLTQIIKNRTYKRDLKSPYPKVDLKTQFLT